MQLSCDHVRGRLEETVEFAGLVEAENSCSSSDCKTAGAGDRIVRLMEGILAVEPDNDRPEEARDDTDHPTHSV